jgi:hypothetical protein
MSLDIGDQPITSSSNLANTAVLGIKDGVEAVRIPMDSIIMSTLDLDGGDATTVSLNILIDIDGGSA